MILWEYSTVVEISLGHDYSLNGGCHSWRIEAAPETQAWMRQHKLLSKSTSKQGRSVLLVAGESRDGNLVAGNMGNVKLRFYMHLLDYQFLSSSTVQVKSGQKIALAGNAWSGGAALVNGMRIVDLVANKFRVFAHPDLENGDQVELINEQSVVATSEVKEGTISFHVPEGTIGLHRLRFPLAREIAESEIYLDTKAVQASVGGIIELELNGNGGLTNQKFHLQFPAKRSFVTFIFHLHPVPPEFTCTLVDASGTIEFDDETESIESLKRFGKLKSSLEDGTSNSRVWILKSKTEVNWSEVPRLGLNLRRSDGMGEEILLRDCPLPFEHDFVVIRHRLRNMHGMPQFTLTI